VEGEYVRGGVGTLFKMEFTSYDRDLRYGYVKVGNSTLFKMEFTSYDGDLRYGYVRK
jgi:hypothetical protein